MGVKGLIKKRLFANSSTEDIGVLERGLLGTSLTSENLPSNRQSKANGAGGVLSLSENDISLLADKADAEGTPVLERFDTQTLPAFMKPKTARPLQNLKKHLKSHLKKNKEKCTTSSPEHKSYPLIAKFYELQEELGKGASAVVWRAKCTLYAEDVAVKLVDLDAISLDLALFHQETATMSAMRDQHVVPLYACFIENKQLWMVEPLIDGGDLNQLLAEACPEGLEEETIATLVKMVLQGLHYIHDQGYVHRDLKAANLLVSRLGDVMIADFTVAKQLERAFECGDPVTVEKAQDFAGTIAWMAPEIIEGVGADSKADVWSLGMTIVEMAWGKHPWLSFPMHKLMTSILHGEPPELPTTRCWSQNMRSFLELCFEQDPKKRACSTELLNHPWLKSVDSGTKGKALLVQHLVPHLQTLQTSKDKTQHKLKQKESFGSSMSAPELNLGSAFTSPKSGNSSGSTRSGTSRAPSLSTSKRIMKSFVDRGWSLPSMSPSRNGSVPLQEDVEDAPVLLVAEAALVKS